MFSKSSARLTCLFLPVHMHGSLSVDPLHLRFHACTLKEISCVIRPDDSGTLHWRQNTPPKDRHSSNTSLRYYNCAPACLLVRTSRILSLSTCRSRHFAVSFHCRFVGVCPVPQLALVLCNFPGALLGAGEFFPRHTRHFFP